MGLDENIASNWDLYLITVVTILLGMVIYSRRPTNQAPPAPQPENQAPLIPENPPSPSETSPLLRNEAPAPSSPPSAPDDLQ